MISIETQGPLAQMENQAKIAELLSVDEWERVELCQVYCAVQTEVLSSFHIASTASLTCVR